MKGLAHPFNANVANEGSLSCENKPYSLLYKRRNAAFTLAEVLITLAIIGVVAVLVLPSFIEKYQERVYISKLRKAYYTLDQAVKHAVEDNGTVDTWPVDQAYDGNIRDEQMVQIILPYLDGVIKTCKSDPNWNIKYCFSAGYKRPDGSNAGPHLGKGTLFMLKDGSSYAVNSTVGSTRCTRSANDYSNFCAYLVVDINGPAGPNVAGKDYFKFMMTKNGVLPMGRKGGYYINSFETGCLEQSKYCSAWVIYNDNMDYLHCPEKLGWNKALSCK